MAGRRRVSLLLCGCTLLLAAAVCDGGPSLLSFPGSAPNDPSYASSSPSGGPTGQWNLFSVNPVDQPLNHASGISADLAWQVTSGHPSIVVAIMDTGVNYDHEDLRNKIWLNRGELPVPDGASCTPPVADPHDCNADGVFSVLDYVGDSRVTDSNGSGAVDRGDLGPAFADSVDDDVNGYVDDLSGFDTNDDDGDEFDHRFFGHGTGRAGILAPETNNGVGVAGVCPDCPLMNVRIDDTFVHTSEGLGKGVVFAVDSGARVINMALGGTSASRFSRGAFDYAITKNVLPVAASANEFSFHQNFSTVFDDVMAIGGVTYDNEGFTNTWLQKANFANYGAHLDVVAPTQVPGAAMGRDDLDDDSLPNHDRYTQTATGTSSAVPHAAGTAALVFSRAREMLDASLLDATGLSLADLSSQEVRQILNRSAEDVTPANANTPLTDPVAGTGYPVLVGWDKWTGYGRIDARAAVDRVGQNTIPPETDINSPDWYSLVNGDVSVGFYANARWASRYHWCLEVGREVEPASFARLDSNDPALAAAADCDGLSAPGAGAGAASSPGLSAADRTDNHTVVWSAGGLAQDLWTLRLRVLDDLGNLGEDRMAVWVRAPDPDDLAGFPCQIDASLESLSVAIADLDGDNQNEVVFADANGAVHALGVGCSEIAGFPVSTDPPTNLPLAFSDAFDGNPANGEVGLVGASVIGGVAVGDLERDGRPEIVVAANDGKVYCWRSDGQRCAGFPAASDPGTSRDPYPPHAFVPNVNPEGFLATPALGDLDGDGRLEIVVGAIDQKLYVFDATGARQAPFPVALFDPAEVAGIDPIAAAGIVSSAALGDLDGDGSLEIVVGTNEVYAEPSASDPSLPGGVFPIDNPVPNQGGSGRAYAVRADGTFLPGWPIKPTSVAPAGVPVVAEGVGSSPALADLDGDGSLEVAATAFVGEATLWNADGSQRLVLAASGASGPGSDGDETTAEGGLASAADQPARFYVSQGIFADFDGDGIGTDYLSGMLGLRILAIALGGGPRAIFDHMVYAWNADTGAVKPAFPRVVEDWQFFSGPAVAEIDGDLLPEVLATSGGYYVHAFNVAGLEPAGWPKLTGHWQTATPSIGDVDADGQLEVVVTTRLGSVHVWKTSGAACQADQWRKFRHDEWNTGNRHTDTRPPNRILDLAALELAGSLQISFTAVGDDGPCGTASAYDLFVSNGALDESNLASASRLRLLPPLAAGAPEMRLVTPPAGTTHVALRAVDEAGNVGRLATAAIGGS